MELTHYKILYKKLDEVTNEDLFLCQFPDSVGSSLIDYVEGTMKLNWDTVKDKKRLMDVFNFYNKQNNRYYCKACGDIVSKEEFDNSVNECIPCVEETIFYGD
jgi:hypothetical protein